jgi:N-acetylneuraminic acid mutarotase
MVAMMSTTLEAERLPATFTFRIVEAVKRIKIHPMPRVAGLPWGLSLAAGIAVVVMTLGSQMAIHQSPELTMFPSETQTLKAREIAVDILSGPQTSVMAGKQGDTDGVVMDQRSSEINSLLAPAKGGGTWTQKADMPTARFILGSAVVDGKIYVIGGAPFSGGFTAVVEEYNPATDTWTRRADMLTARQGVVAAAVDGIIYAIGGSFREADIEILSAVEAYDPARDTWTRKADMPTARRSAGTAVVDGKIYVIGGNSSDKAPWVTSVVEAYDPATDTWTKKADMPTARFAFGACVVDGRIYVSGGATKVRDMVGVWDSVPTVEVYDPATDTWTQASDMPWRRFTHSASVVDGKMYIISGAPDEVDMGVAIEVSKTVDVYDPATDTWTTAADFPTARGNSTAAVVDGKIYTIGGNPMHGPFPLSTVYEFDPGLSGNIAVTSPAGKLLRTWGEAKSE